MIRFPIFSHNTLQLVIAVAPRLLDFGLKSLSPRLFSRPRLFHFVPAKKWAMLIYQKKVARAARKCFEHLFVFLLKLPFIFSSFLHDEAQGSS